MRFSGQKFWSELPFPPPRDLPGSKIEPMSPVSPALVGRFFTLSHLGSQTNRLLGGTVLNSLEGESPWENGEGPEVPRHLCTDCWRTFPAFGYARRLDLTINIKDVAWENGSWINTWVIKNALFLEVSFTDYIPTLCMFCWLYALSSLFLAPIKRLDCRNKLVSPCRDCPSVVLSGSPFPSPGDISPTSGARTGTWRKTEQSGEPCRKR